MAAINATTYPVYGQAFRLEVAFRDTSGNLISGWTGAASLISIDGAAATAGATPTEIAISGGGSMGLGYIDLTAAQMTASCVSIRCTITNSSATAFAAALYPINLTEPVGTWDNQSVLRLEWIIQDIAALLLNQVTGTGAQQTITTRNGSTTKFSGTYSEADTQAVRSLLK